MIGFQLLFPQMSKWEELENWRTNVTAIRLESMAAHLGHDSTKYLYFVFPSK